MLHKSIIDEPPNQWTRVAGTFTADWQYQYILIGNFYTDDETLFFQKEGDLQYSFYMVDDVQLRKLDQPDTTTIHADMLEVGNTIVLKNIYFEHDQSTLLPASFPQLDELVKLMDNSPAMQIQIGGHTDLTGKAAYNLKLSQARAERVATYLEEKGIESERMKTKGFGESFPISTDHNATNRRVELRILAK